MNAQMNGSPSDFGPGISLGPRSSGSGSEILLTSPQYSGQHGDMGNLHMAMASMSMSLATLGLDMSLEEAVEKVRDLTKENAELRENVQQTNITMKQQYQILSDWKHKWEDEREQVRQKHEQARVVVTNLREEVKIKDVDIRRMELELIQYEDKANHTAPSMKAQLMSLEQIKSELEKRCADYQRQVAALHEEVQSLKNMRDDQSNENDKYLKIVRDKEERITSLERSNAALTEEFQEVDKIKESRNKLEEQKKLLVAENKQLLQQLQKLRASDDDIDQGVADMSMQNGFVHVYTADGGSDVSDSVPFTDPPPSQSCPPPAEASLDVLCAAIPVYPTSTKPTEVAKVQGHKEEHTMGDVLLQLQSERSKAHALESEIQHKNQELEALHRKVHSTEELLAEREHRLNVKLTQLKLESEQKEEILRGQLEQAVRNLKHPQSTSGRASLESQQGLHSEEDARVLKTQVTSLVSELQAANDRNRSLEELCLKQKERLQHLEAQVESQHDEVEIQRAKHDSVIENLRVDVAKLDNQLSGERKRWQTKEMASERLSREYARLFQQYQETAKQNEAFKKELQQRMTMSLVQDTSRSYEERIDNLTAQLITAEESMHDMKQANSKLKDQLQQMGGEVDMVEVLKAQAEVYKSDFEAERGAREKLHEEKEVMREENNQLHLRNQQLQEELSHLSENQIAEMQRRHGQRGITQQFRNFFGGGGNQPPGDEYMYADGVREDQRLPVGGGESLPTAPYQPHNRPEEGQWGDNQQGEHLPRQVPIEDPSDPQLVCPMCQEQSPDIDTLQLHVIDCIK